jgi:hypothetical protein
MHPTLLLAVAALVTAQPPLPVLVIRDSGALRISNVQLRYDGDVLRLSGRVCRRANWWGIQASAFDIDRISADGNRAEHADAYLPRLSLRIDQACGGWQTRFKGPIAAGDRIVVCVPRPHSHCRSD